MSDHSEGRWFHDALDGPHSVDLLFHQSTERDFDNGPLFELAVVPPPESRSTAPRGVVMMSLDETRDLFALIGKALEEATAPRVPAYEDRDQLAFDLAEAKP